MTYVIIYRVIENECHFFGGVLEIRKKWLKQIIDLLETEVFAKN